MKKRLFMLTFAAVTGATGACARQQSPRGYARRSRMDRGSGAETVTQPAPNSTKNPRRPIKATRIRLFGARYSAASAAPSAACDSAALRITSVR